MSLAGGAVLDRAFAGDKGDPVLVQSDGDTVTLGFLNSTSGVMSISEQTVKNHMSSILRKLSVNDRTQAVVYAMKQGWIRIPED